MEPATRFDTIAPRDNPVCQTLALPPKLVHDLLQPLNAFGLLSGQLQEDLDRFDTRADDVGDSLRSSLRLLCMAVEAEERLLRSLRQFWRNAVDIRQPVLESVAIDGVLQSLLRSHRQEFAELPLFMPAPTTLRCISNLELLEMALGCLVQNAALHARSRVRIVLDATDTWIRIVIEDDGLGVPPGIVPCLGMPFVRDITHQRIKKTGLGLGIHLAASASARLGHGFSYTSSGGTTRFALDISRRPVLSGSAGGSRP